MKYGKIAVMRRVRVKICGITQLEDAIIAAEAGADAIGLNFYGKSPRVIDVDTACQIVDMLPPFIAKVGLFVDESSEYICSVLERVKLDLLQFHGDENQEECLNYGVPYIKAIKMHDGVDLETIVSKFDKSSAILADTYVDGIPGGTGKSFNWNLISRDILKPVILAGGLTPENVNNAINIARPYAVDVSSGVEINPGKKDKEKMIKFIQNAKDITV